MMAKDQDHCYVFNIANIEKAVSEGKTTTLGDSPVPVVDARGENGEFVQRVPVPKSPHGVNIDPTGKYAVCAGKLSPTCTVIDIDKLADVFGGSIKPRDAVAAEPEVGLGTASHRFRRQRKCLHLDLPRFRHDQMEHRGRHQTVPGRKGGS